MKETHEYSLHHTRHVPPKIRANSPWVETRGHDLVAVPPRKLARHNDITLRGLVGITTKFGSDSVLRTNLLLLYNSPE